MDYSGNKYSKGHLTQSETEEMVRDNLSEDGKTLNLNACYLKELGAKDIAGFEFLRELTTLELGTNQIGPKGARHLATSPHLVNLVSLNLYYNEIGNEGVKYITLSDNLLSLVSLNLSNNRISDEGARTLAKFLPLFSRLEKLDLRYNYIKEEGIKELLEARKNVPSLKQLLLDKEEGFQIKTL